MLTHDNLFQQVGEEQLWLADETVLPHFSSLKLESHVDSSEIVERLRAHGTKRRKGANTKFVPAEDENGKTDVDVLKIVREINLDHLGNVG
ncbi:unnamed protein product [Brassica oleracea var. botrytis]|uniref:Uncharacterized protein n=1 Tax=Brassica oleracea TaxID=3712 RepID=A0A3P6GA51_BRAOL|nr:unnamed protein product [Brassica oleracea]